MLGKTVPVVAMTLMAMSTIPCMAGGIGRNDKPARILGETGASQARLVGIWSGKLDLGPSGVLRIVVRVNQSPNGNLSASLKSPDQSPMPIALDSIRLTQDKVLFVSSALDATYTGTLTGTKIDGTFTQHGQARPLALTKTDRDESADAATTVLTAKQAAVYAGTWRGALQAGGQTLHLVLHIARVSPGRYAASLDSTDQGAYGLVSTFTVNGGAFDLQVPSVRGGYHGVLSANHRTLKGTWSQGGASLPLSLHKG